MTLFLQGKADYISGLEIPVSELLHAAEARKALPGPRNFRLAAVFQPASAVIPGNGCHGSRTGSQKLWNR